MGEVRNEKNSWKIRALALTLMAVCWLSGCSAHKEISVTVAETQEETRELSLNTETEAETQPEAEPEERCEKDGKIQSYLTGEWTDVAKANRRPLAIMMSNDKAALPQYGINHAGVVYEAPVEGSMNRYMALIEDYDDLDRIGSVRSCRPYYTFFAREFEAVYAHYGQNTFALPYLEQMEHLDGIKGNGASISGPRSGRSLTMPMHRDQSCARRSRRAVMRMRTRRAMRGIILLCRRVRRCALRMVSQRPK